MKVNRKINLAEAVKFEYNKECFDEIEKLIFHLNAKLTVSKARHPSAVGAFQITWYSGFSPHKNVSVGFEGDFIIFNKTKIEVFDENKFQEQYECVV